MAYADSRSAGKNNVSYMVRLAVLVAILFLLEVTGLGLIKTPGLEFTIMQVPVIIGAIVMGPAAGAILGGVFGLISFWECFGKSAFGVVLLSVSPVGTFMTCVPTRILMGFLCGLIFRALYRIDRSKLWSFGVAGLAGALINTTLFMGMLVAFFYNAAYIQGFVTMLQGIYPWVTNPFFFVIAFVGIQGLLEAIICTIAGAAISKALYKVLNK